MSWKRGKDRYVPLPEPGLEIATPLLGDPPPSHLALSVSLWCGRTLVISTQPLSDDGVRRAFDCAVQECKLQKPATVHTFTPLLCNAFVPIRVPLRIIQAYLGTFFPHYKQALYTHLVSKERMPSPIQSINQVLENFMASRARPDIFLVTTRERIAQEICHTHANPLISRPAVQLKHNVRTEALGGQVYRCPNCVSTCKYSYQLLSATRPLSKSCQNRKCLHTGWRSKRIFCCL